MNRFFLYLVTYSYVDLVIVLLKFIFLLGVGIFFLILVVKCFLVVEILKCEIMILNVKI